MNITCFIRFPPFEAIILIISVSSMIFKWCLCQATDQSTEGALDLLGFSTEGLQIVHSKGVAPLASGTAVAWPRWLDR